MIKCKVCGCEFPAVNINHYIARDNGKTGLATAFGNNEERLYDAFDCPICGCQAIAQERKRDYIVCVETEADDDEEEAENE